MANSRVMIKLLFVLVILLSSYFLLLPMIVDDASILPSWILADSRYQFMLFIVYVVIMLFSFIMLIR